jgi:hypothetical protein
MPTILAPLPINPLPFQKFPVAGSSTGTT